jgi:hypothetical protein
MLMSQETTGYQEFLECMWTEDDVALMPDIGLRDWRCFQLRLPDSVKPTLHLVGRAGRSHRMHVSNPVTSTDRTAWTACVAGGIVYALCAPDDDYEFNLSAWKQWLASHRALSFVDVTAEFMGQFD